MSVILYGCEAWSLKLGEGCRLRVFQNWFLWRIFGPKRDVKGEWRRLHNEEHHSLYRSPSTVRVIKSRILIWAGHVAKMEEGRMFKRLTGILAGTRPLGRPRHRWEDNIRINFKEIGINTRN